MTALLVVVGLAVAAAVGVRVTFWRKSDRPPDLGAVSTQWISEHRVGSGQDSHR